MTWWTWVVFVLAGLALGCFLLTWMALIALLVLKIEDIYERRRPAPVPLDDMFDNEDTAEEQAESDVIPLVEVLPDPLGGDSVGRTAPPELSPDAGHSHPVHGDSPPDHRDPDQQGAHT